MGGEITPVVRRLGELQAVGLRALFAPEAFEPMAQELTAMLLSPNTRGGLLRPDWAKEAAAALPARQATPASEAERYADRRLTEEMCCFEDYAVPLLGDEEDAKAIHYQKLTRHYHDLLAASPVEIFCCGTDFDSAFGLMDTIEKAAEILIKVMSCGGKRQSISKEQILALSEPYHVNIDAGMFD